MTVTENKAGNVTELVVCGRLDTSTAPELEKKVNAVPQGVKQLLLDLGAVEYISSAGLRVVLLAHKRLLGFGGKLVIKNPSLFCRQVLSATGMDSVLTIQ